MKDRRLGAVWKSVKSEFFGRRFAGRNFPGSAELQLGMTAQRAAQTTRMPSWSVILPLTLSTALPGIATRRGSALDARMRFISPILFAIAFASACAVAPVFAEPAAFVAAEHDPFVGDWQPVDPGEYVAQVFEYGADTYRVNVLAAFDENESARAAVLSGPRTRGESVSELRGDDGWSGTIRPDCCGSPKLEITNARTGAHCVMIHVVRPNRTLREKPPAGALVLFANDSADAPAWKRRDGGILESVPGTGRAVAGGRVPAGGGGGALHLEFRMLGAPSEAVVVLPGGCEITLTESFGRDGDSGAGASIRDKAGKLLPVLARAERARLQWQTLDVEFHAQSGRGSGVHATRATVFLNGIKIYDDVALARAGKSRGDDAALALALEERGAPVQFRNVWIKSGSGVPPLF